MSEEKTSPDSWERLEGDVREAAKTGDVCSYFGWLGKKSCVGCPARMFPGLCSTAALQDVLKRAKALAGVCDDG